MLGLGKYGVCVCAVSTKSYHSIAVSEVSLYGGERHIMPLFILSPQPFLFRQRCLGHHLWKEPIVSIDRAKKSNAIKQYDGEREE